MNKRALGFIFILLAVAIIISNASITGAVIGTSLSNSISFIAFIFFIVGLILMLRVERNYAQEILDQRRFVTILES